MDTVVVWQRTTAVCTFTFHMYSPTTANLSDAVVLHTITAQISIGSVM